MGPAERATNLESAVSDRTKRGMDALYLFACVRSNGTWLALRSIVYSLGPDSKLYDICMIQQKLKIENRNSTVVNDSATGESFPYSMASHFSVRQKSGDDRGIHPSVNHHME